MSIRNAVKKWQERFLEKTFSEKIFYIFCIMRKILIIGIIFVLLFLLGVWIWLWYPTVVNNEEFIKNNFLNEYKKNTKELISLKPEKPLILFTEKEEKELLKKTGCVIENFSYEKTHDTFYGEGDNSTVVFSCKNTGIHGRIDQTRLIGNEYNEDYGDRYNSVRKGSSRCFFYVEQPNLSDEIRCSTEGKFSLKQ